MPLGQISRRKILIGDIDLSLSIVTQVLLNHGADMNARRNSRITLLHLAVRRGRDEVVVRIWIMTINLNSHNLSVSSIFYYQICKFQMKLFNVIFMFLIKSIQIINKM